MDQQERVYMYSLVEGTKARCGITTNTDMQNVIQDVMHHFDRPRHVTIFEVNDMAVNDCGEIVLKKGA